MKKSEIKEQLTLACFEFKKESLNQMDESREIKDFHHGQAEAYSKVVEKIQLLINRCF